MRKYVAFFLIWSFGATMSWAADQSFIDHCAKSYEKDKKCPSECKLECDDSAANPDCPKICVPQECKTFGADQCPQKFCTVIEECSKEKICLPRIPPDQIPSCGGLAYSANDVECCKGLVKRCGFDYLDGSCNIDGKGTVYRFSICIPCGDGVCTNFENHCNCPEDCKKDLIPLN